METTFRLGVWTIRPHAREIMGDGKRVRIDHKAMGVLLLLAERYGEVVTRQELMEKIWPETHVSEDALNVAVSNLRRALEDRVQSPKYIKTVPRVGYKLISPVAPAIEPQREQAPPPTRNKPLLATVSLFVLAAVLFLAFFPLGRKDDAAIETMAVLPLANFTGDPDNNYLVDGLTEALITRLARHQSPRIISRTSIMTYKNTDKTLTQIAEELKVDAILQGSIIKTESQIRVNLQLIDARTDQHLWAEHYDWSFWNISHLESKIVKAVAYRVKARIASPSPRDTVSATAYDAYLRGRFYRNQPTAPDYEKAIVHFEKAIQENPDFAPAHAALAESWFMLAEIGKYPTDQAFQLGKQAADRAVALDPGLGEARLALAIAYFGLDWDFEAAETAFQKALTLDPQNTQCMRWHVRFLTVLGRFDEAIDQIRRIQELDPIAYSKVTLANTLAAANRLEEAMAELDRLDGVMPESPMVWLNYASLHERMGDLEAAFAAFKKYLYYAKTPAPRIQAMETAFAQNGAVGVYRLLFDMTPVSPNAYQSPVLLAGRQMQLGEPERAMSLLERGFQERDMQILWIGQDHRFAPLHDDPRFRSIIKKIGLPPLADQTSMAAKK